MRSKRYDRRRRRKLQRKDKRPIRTLGDIAEAGGCPIKGYTKRPPGDVTKLRGECVICGAMITEADYDRQAVISAIAKDFTVVACVKHVTDEATYEATVQAMARAIAEKANQE